MNPQLPPAMPSGDTEPYSMAILVIVIMAILGIAILEIVSRHRRHSSPDNVIHRNVKRRCRQCGRPVITDVFTLNPTCIVCQDEE